MNGQAGGPSFTGPWKVLVYLIGTIAVLAIGAMAGLVVFANTATHLLDSSIQANTDRIKAEARERADDIADIRKRQDMQRQYLMELVGKLEKEGRVK